MIKITQTAPGVYTVKGTEEIAMFNTITYWQVENVDLDTVKTFVMGRNIDDLELEYGFERLENRVTDHVFLHENTGEVAV